MRCPTEGTNDRARVGARLGLVRARRGDVAERAIGDADVLGGASGRPAVPRSQINAHGEQGGAADDLQVNLAKALA